MADDSSSVSSIARRTTVTTLVAAVVGGLITWGVGWLPSVWSAIVAAAAWIWGILFFSVPVPAVILAILALPFMIWILSAVRRTPAESGPAAPSEFPPLLALSKLDRAILQLLRDADGLNVHFEDVAVRLEVSKLELERECEGLTQRGLIEPHHDVLRGAHIGLTRKGRDFVIEQGFPRSALHSDW